MGNRVIVTYKEIRTISCENLRRACIENNWFDAGNNDEYSFLFESCCYSELGANELLGAAAWISMHTARYESENNDCEIVPFIASILCRYCDYRFIPVTLS